MVKCDMVFDDGGSELSCPGRKGRGRTCDSTQRGAGWSASWGTWALALPLWDSSAHHCTTNDVGHFPLTQQVVGLAGVHPSSLGEGGLHPPDTSAVYGRARKTKNHRHSHLLLQTCLGLTCLAGISFVLWLEAGAPGENPHRPRDSMQTLLKAKHRRLLSVIDLHVNNRRHLQSSLRSFCSSFPNI